MRSFVSLRPGSRFGLIYRTGRRRRSGGITVLQAPGHLGTPQVGVVAAKNVGNAVQRNRAKRRLREAAHRVDLRPKTAYVVVASPEVLAAPFSELVDWLRSAITTDSGTRNKDM